MTAAIEDAWYDEDAGPLVRLYAVTGGRVAANGPQEFTVSTIVLTVNEAGAAGLPAEQAGIVRLARTPLSVSEIAARVGLPLGPVRVMLGDLRDRGLVTVPQPPADGAATRMRLLERLLDGLAAL